MGDYWIFRLRIWRGIGFEVGGAALRQLLLEKPFKVQTGFVLMGSM